MAKIRIRLVHGGGGFKVGDEVVDWGGPATRPFYKIGGNPWIIIAVNNINTVGYYDAQGRTVGTISPRAWFDVLRECALPSPGPVYNGAFSISKRISDYPSKCPRCGKPAYVGANEVVHEVEPVSCVAPRGDIRAKMR